MYPAGRDFYLMPEYVHPASPTGTDLLKNLTEKTGTHTLFYDQEKQRKTTGNNRHSFHRFCTRAIWWSLQRRSNETAAPRSGRTCFHNVVIKCIYRQPLNCRNKSWGTPISPSTQHGTNTPWGFHLCYKQSQDTSRVGTTGMAATLSPRHFTTFENHFVFIYTALFQCISTVNESKCFAGVQVH